MTSRWMRTSREMFFGRGPAVALSALAAAATLVACGGGGTATDQVAAIIPVGGAAPTSNETVTIQAEKGRLSGAAATKANGQAMEGSLVTGFEEVGATVEMTVNSPRAGEGTIDFRYANGAGEIGLLSLYVNDKFEALVVFHPTGGWSTYASGTGFNIPLVAGVNKIRLQRDEFNLATADIDAISVVMPAASTSTGGGSSTSGSSTGGSNIPGSSTGTAPPPGSTSTGGGSSSTGGSTGASPLTNAPPTSTATSTSGASTVSTTSAMTDLPYVNKSLIPAARGGSSTLDLAQTGEMPQKDAGGIGAFRNVCQFSHMNFDDPLVFPGQQGASHLHTFFGNSGTRFDSTPQTIANSGQGTCRGGIANRSAYWVPSMIDTRDGRPLAPEFVNVYYKTGYNGIKDANIKPWPANFRMISGNAMSMGSQWNVWYTCNGGARSATIPACSGMVTMDVQFPQCWDGVNLDSPDHKSHVAFASGGACPKSHPIPTPELSIHVNYRTQYGDSSTWRLSSDRKGSPAGSSGHADWIHGWDQGLMNTWVTRVINPGLSGGSHMIGDGRVMTCKFPGCV